MPPLGENYREYHVDDKSQWGSGPWQHEPDKAQWIDPATGLDCLIVRNHHGSLCGYVGVPPEHPLHGKHYDVPNVSVHGGLTFADACQHGHPERGICHLPAPGRPDGVWWFGFDCGHYMDVQPGLDNYLRARRSPEIAAMQAFIDKHDPSIYRDWGYVVEEVTDLARQLKVEGGR